jgi:ATP-dependent phosphoenolpyruvate carboxykinase
VKFYTPYGWKGDKYDETKHLPIKEIAKLIKKEIQKKFPDIKVSVRSKIYSGGQSIRITIKEVPFRVINPEWGQSFYVTRKYTKEAERLIEEIEKIANRYRFSDCDPMIDYFHTNFYLTVEFDSKLEKQ